MSIRLKRAIIIACIAVSVAAIAAQVALAVTGHRYAAAGFVFPVVSVASGLVFLRSTRGRP